MHSDKSYQKLVEKLKNSKSDRKRFIRLVDGFKMIHKKLRKRSSNHSKETSREFEKLVAKFNKAIRDSR